LLLEKQLIDSRVYSGTPVLGRKLTLRKETIKALEVRRNSVMAERRKSQMKTLGAHNGLSVGSNNSRGHRSSTAGVFDRPLGGQVNRGYESEDDLDTRNSVRLQNIGNRNSVSWQDPETGRRNSINQHL
jgi:chitin synthase